MKTLFYFTRSIMLRLIKEEQVTLSEALGYFFMLELISFMLFIVLGKFILYQS